MKNSSSEDSEANFCRSIPDDSARPHSKTPRISSSAGTADETPIKDWVFPRAAVGTGAQSQIVRGSGPLNTCSTTRRKDRPVASSAVEPVVSAVLARIIHEPSAASADTLCLRVKRISFRSRALHVSHLLPALHASRDTLHSLLRFTGNAL